MIVPFGILFAFGPHSNHEVNAESLEILLETLVDLNLVYLRSAQKKGLAVPFLYEAGVRYGRTQSWDTIPDLYMKGVGDCKSLTAAFVAYVRFHGGQADPVFRFNPRQRDGGLDYHILVMTDGKLSWKGKRIETNHDPSKVLGMPTND
jgi:hypothetical protein